jgi:uncharacterized membrane protein YbhN (UPF0104 family)
MKRHLSKKLLIQLTITALLLFFVLRKLDFGKLYEVLRRVSPLDFVYLCLLYTGGQLISSVKWAVLLRHAGIKRRYMECLRAYFLGMFFNSFGLGTVGGDVARAVAIKPEKGERAAAFATVIADRVHGLGVLLTIGAVSIAAVRPPVLGAYAGEVAAVSVVAMLIGWFIGPKGLVFVCERLGKFTELARRIACAFPTRPRTFLLATVLSVIFHCSQLFLHLLFASTLAVKLSLSYIFATIPIANAASALPISIQGLGVRESAYLALLSPIGISPEICVAFGALWFFTTQVVSGIGALIIAPGLLTGRKQIEELVSEMEEEA